MNGKIYSPDQLEWLRLHYPLMRRRELTDVFNLIFQESRPMSAIVACLRNHKIRSGRDGRFERGHRSWNAGKKGYMGPNKTSFKKGHLPHNTRPLYAERVSKDGYIEISVPKRNPYTGFQRRYQSKHTWLWERAHGPVPPGHVVIFKDGNHRNFDLENLVLVTRAELLEMNLHGYKDAPPPLKPSIMALARLEAAAGFRSRPARGRRKRNV